jgi:hypothetical protein
MNNSRIPTTQNLTLSYTFSLAVALLMTGVSLAALLVQSAIYPTEELRRSFVSNDVVNLFIGLPILLGSMWLTRRGKLIGLLFWPGAQQRLSGRGGRDSLSSSLYFWKTAPVSERLIHCPLEPMLGSHQIIKGHLAYCYGACFGLCATPQPLLSRSRKPRYTLCQ